MDSLMMLGIFIHGGPDLRPFEVNEASLLTSVDF